MIRAWGLLLGILLTTAFSASSQKIVYSEPEKDDTRRLDFEIVGKIGGNFLIYKNIRNKNWIAILDNDMKQIAKADQDYLPDNDRVVSEDLIIGSLSCIIWTLTLQTTIKYVILILRADNRGEGDT